MTVRVGVWNNDSRSFAQVQERQLGTAAIISDLFNARVIKLHSETECMSRFSVKIAELVQQRKARNTI